MPSLDVVIEHDEADESVVALPPMPQRYISSDDIGIAKPPLPVRRHSVAQTDHKHLHEESPQFFSALKDLFDERPDSPSHSSDPADGDLSTLEKQTLENLFSSAVAASAPTKHALSYELHAPHQLDLHDQLFRSSKQPKVDGKEPDRTSLAGPSQWMAALRERKVAAPHNGKQSGGGAAADQPPEGWQPTLTTMRAVLKLRKLHSQRKSGSDATAKPSKPASYAAAAATATPATPAPAASLELHQLTDPEFDLSAFMEECWIAQAAADPTFNQTILYGAYDEPMQHATHAPPQPSAHTHYDGGAAAAAHGYDPSGVYAPATYSPRTTMAPMPFVSMQAPAAPPMPSPVMQHQAYAPQMWPPSPAPSPMMMASHAVPASPVGIVGWGGGGWSAAPSPMMQAPMMNGMQVMVQEAQQVAPSPMIQAPSGLPHGALAAMAQEQEGSRTLQTMLWSMGPSELAMACDELAPHLPSLVTHPFGNYLVSTMAYLSPAHLSVYHALAGRLVSLMQHPQGSRVCQAAFERLPTQLSQRLVGELAGHITETSCSTHGSWSVVCAHKHTGAPFILVELAADVARLATQQNGSRVVQRVLAEAGNRGEDVSAPLEALSRLGASHLASLAQDKFGNYVVQIALRHAPPTSRQHLLGLLLPALPVLSVEKCGSNVAEVIVELASPQQLAEAKSALAAKHGGDCHGLKAHAYGTYVVAALDARG